MPLHHNFKHLALGSNPIHVTYCSDALYNHCSVIKLRHFPHSSDNISQGLCVHPNSSSVCLGVLFTSFTDNIQNLGKSYAPSSIWNHVHRVSFKDRCQEEHS